MKATIRTTRGNISLDLFQNEAKYTVANFVNLSQKGFYNKLTFHRVIDDFNSDYGSIGVTYKLN